MISDLATSLASIERALRSLHRDILLRSLRPGLPPDVVRERLAPTDRPVPPELVALYGWRDGTQAEDVILDDIHVVPGFYLQSTADAMADYRAFVVDPRWAVGWLPILADGGGHFYVLDCSSPLSTPVRHFRLEEVEHPIEFLSLGAFLSTVAAAYERGTYFIDGRGCLEMDDLVFAGLAAELNPDVAWWREP